MPLVEEEGTGLAKVQRKSAEHSLVGEDEARAVSGSRLSWAPKERLGDGGGGPLGQMKGESRWVAMAAWCPPSKKTTGGDWTPGLRGEYVEILVCGGH